MASTTLLPDIYGSLTPTTLYDNYSLYQIVDVDSSIKSLTTVEYVTTATAKCGGGLSKYGTPWFDRHDFRKGFISPSEATSSEVIPTNIGRARYNLE